MSKDNDEFDLLAFLYGLIAGVVFILVIYYIEGIIQ